MWWWILYGRFVYVIMIGWFLVVDDVEDNDLLLRL